MDMSEYDHDSHRYSPRASTGRYFFLVIIGSLSAIVNILLILLILVHRHRFWVSYRNYLLSMLISSSCFVIIGFSVEANTVDGHGTDPRTMDSSLCRAWYVVCGAVFDGSLLSLGLINIDRVMSILSPQNYTTKSYERGSRLTLCLTWVTLIIVNLSFAFSYDQNAQSLPSLPCIHLMHHRNGHLSLVWGSLHFISSVFLVIAIAHKTKAFPPNEIENKVTGCVLAILLLDFFIAFLSFAPKIARLIPPLHLKYNHQEITDLLFLVDWSTQMLPPLFWLLDSNIRKSIKMICCCRCCGRCDGRCCIKQRKSVDLVEASGKQGSKMTSEPDM